MLWAPLHKVKGCKNSSCFKTGHVLIILGTIKKVDMSGQCPMDMSCSEVFRSIYEGGIEISTGFLKKRWMCLLIHKFMASHIICFLQCALVS